MRLTIPLAAATLLGLLPLPVLADNNLGNIVQDGDTNEASIVQTGTGNSAGDDNNDIEQHGVRNLLSLTQSGDGNDIGRSGRGIVQTGTLSDDAAVSNSATIVQQSNGNSIGELVQSTLGTHATTGNTLVVMQLTGGSNTSRSIEQVQGSADAANFADITQNGLGNWLERLSQQSGSNEGSNRVSLTFTGDYNGVSHGAEDRVGALRVLAAGAGSAAGAIVQDTDLSGGAGNTIELALTGSFNQYGATQIGVDNSLFQSITGIGNSFGAYQAGRHNQITSGGVAGDGNDIGIRQLGEANAASTVLRRASSDNEVGVGQDGDANRADVTLEGNHGIIGASQQGNGHIANIAITGDRNVVLGVQINDRLTASVGDTLRVSINGSDNNGVAGGGPQSFSGAALDAARGGETIARAFVVTPDASLMLAPSAPALGPLVPGVLVQWGEGNQMDIRVGTTAAASGNLFAALQKGNGSTLTATVNGMANEFVVLQLGDGDEAGINQDGVGNSIGIRQ